MNIHLFRNFPRLMCHPFVPRHRRIVPRLEVARTTHKQELCVGLLVRIAAGGFREMLVAMRATVPANQSVNRVEKYSRANHGGDLHPEVHQHMTLDGLLSQRLEAFGTLDAAGGLEGISH